MFKLIILTLAGLILNIAMTWMIINSLHLSVAFAPLLLFSVLSGLSLFINITPANLGVKEVVYLFSSSVLGFSVDQILSIAIIDRGVMFIALAGLWLVSYKLESPTSLAQKV